jgi:hypothetical protein
VRKAEDDLKSVHTGRDPSSQTDKFVEALKNGRLPSKQLGSEPSAQTATTAVVSVISPEMTSSGEGVEVRGKTGALSLGGTGATPGEKAGEVPPKVGVDPSGHKGAEPSVHT